jgi:hypothetical protein
MMKMLVIMMMMMMIVMRMIMIVIMTMIVNIIDGNTSTYNYNYFFEPDNITGKVIDIYTANPSLKVDGRNDRNHRRPSLPTAAWVWSLRRYD